METLNEMVETVVTQHDGSEVVEAAKYLANGFEKLHQADNPRLQVRVLSAATTVCVRLPLSWTDGASTSPQST